MNKDHNNKFPWEVLLIVIVLAGAYLRLVGMDWDGTYHLHPDERFLNMVETAIRPVHSISEYFDTSNSTLNPHNVGYSFFVYGTLPIFLVRFVAELVNHTGYDQVQLVGRACSAMADIGTIILVYFAAQNLFRKKWLGLLAAGFYAFSVLPIQLSHYFTVDTFSVFFAMLTVLLLSYIQRMDGGELLQEKKSRQRWIARVIIFSAFAGITLGMAAASKINTVLLALIFPCAFIFSRWFWNKENRPNNSMQVMLAGWVTAAVLFIITFRILQPYAFAGPGIMSGLNERWLANLKELSALSNSTSGYPPSVQWANRDIFFAIGNLVKFGLGIPLGVLSIAGAALGLFLVEKKDRPAFLMLFTWGIGYTFWQASQHTNSMRYLIIVYPFFCIFSAVFLVSLWNRIKDGVAGRKWISRVMRVSLVIVTLFVLIATAAWAYAFTGIYTRPITRIEASEWIFNNIPGPINLHIETEEGERNQPLAYPYSLILTSERKISLTFVPSQSGDVVSVNFDFLRDPSLSIDEKTVQIDLVDTTKEITYTSIIRSDFLGLVDPRGSPYSVMFDAAVPVEEGQAYTLEMQIIQPQKSLSIMGEINLVISGGGVLREEYLVEAAQLLRQGESWQTPFTPSIEGNLSGISLYRVLDWSPSGRAGILEATVYAVSDSGLVAMAKSTADLPATVNVLSGKEVTFLFPEPIRLVPNIQYILELRNAQHQGSIAVYGSKQALESSWDDPLPYPVYGSNAFDYYNGIYRTDLNFELYWDDNIEKFERMIDILDKADTLFISSNRQWGSLSRLPGYYPLATQYYRALLGCPVDKEVPWCYSVAEPGMFTGALGFELVNTFTSEPSIGPFKVNTQFAEEAFTVYDHPKVFVFRKTESFDLEEVKRILGSVQLTGVPSINRYDGTDPSNLMLTEDRSSRQLAAGTWNELFPSESLLNRSPVIALLVWYLFMTALGVCSFPLTRIVFKGLKDKGYGFSRMLSLLAIAWLVWISGSKGISVTKGLIFFSLAGYFLFNVILAWIFWKDIQQDLKNHWRVFLNTEIVLLGFFIFFLMIRIGNPDLWHPWKGGEKPMDLSYFTAVLKSDTFPPYDPWFSGGYINYYYYGFVIVGMPIKLLGISPAIAYNLILPTLFSLVGAGAFSIGSTAAYQIRKSSMKSSVDRKGEFPDWAGGLIASIVILVLGNLGTVGVIINGFQKIGSESGNFQDASFFQRLAWTFRGIGGFFSGKNFPYAPGEWYWLPSRAIPGEAITEFPYFTFLYADLHAHLLALPVTITALGWSLAMVLRQWDWAGTRRRFGWLNFGLTLSVGGLIIGALRPTNTWDTYTYLPFALIAVLYSAVRYGIFLPEFFKGRKKVFAKILLAALCMLVLFGLSYVMYQDFSEWYRQGYNAVDFWAGDRTPLGSYVTHWGLFLFIFFSWLFVEIKNWMAETPASALERLRPYREVIWIGFGCIPVLMILSLIAGIEISLAVIPLIAAGAILIFRRQYPDIKRFLLFMMLTGLLLTLVVEVVVLRGDIGRMNTVFKIYMQAWTLNALASGGMLFSLCGRLMQINGRARKVWLALFIALTMGAFLFTITATFDKITDRMSADAPHSLDGSLYMKTSTYYESERTMDLEQDYQAIRWMQQNIEGTPTIVEGSVSEYRWGSRYTINTGLPGVVGWNWHQRQQRGVYSAELVQRRVDEVGNFYNTVNLDEVQKFLQNYHVKYIVVGQMEKAIYSEEGIQKFDINSGILWIEVFQYKDTKIYKVLE